MNHHILVVEDNATHRNIMQEILADMGLTVTPADNGYTALAKISANPEKYNLVIMDWEMPEMNGLDAVRSMRAHQEKDGWPHIPVIAFTSNKKIGDEEKCLAAGMDDYMTKDIFLPKWRDLLEEKLEKWITSESQKNIKNGGA